MKIPVITTAAAAVLSTILLSGCVKIEWRGGMTPSLNWNIEGDGNALTSSNTPAKDFRLKGIPTTTDWPDFRGPGRRGIAPEQGIALD